MADLAGFYGRFDLIHHCFMQSYGVSCLLVLCFFILADLLQVIPTILAFCLRWVQRNRPIQASNTPMNNSHHSQSIHKQTLHSEYEERQEKEKRRINEIPIGILIHIE